MHVSSEHGGDRILHVARLDVPRKLGRYHGGARTTLRAVSGLVLATQSCREDKDSDVKWSRGWLSGGGLAGGESAAPIRHAGWARRLSRPSSAWVQLRNPGAPKHIGRMPGGVSRPWDRTVTWRRRAHLRSGRRTGWRVFEQVRTMVPHHPRCGGRPERCSRADDN